MAERDFARLTRLMLDEFKGVHDRFDKHDQRFNDVDSDLANIRGTLKNIRTELEDLKSEVENITGYRTEIDHALERIAAIEKNAA